ncbi:hypothetical protein AAH979_34540 [Plantactinospora sp. ZYX-F-223]|uniref:hypothetical protein n=1 Tax=Plantactinospora sp. ZYX-F-223 TaxID=3144103 RepID=UPI0031FD4835
MSGLDCGAMMVRDIVDETSMRCRQAAGTPATGGLDGERVLHPGAEFTFRLHAPLAAA